MPLGVLDVVGNSTILHLQILVLKNIFFGERGGCQICLVTISLRMVVVIIFLELMRSYTANENHIGSAVNEILQYKQTDRQTICYLYICIVTIPVQICSLLNQRSRLYNCVVWQPCCLPLSP